MSHESKTVSYEIEGKEFEGKVFWDPSQEGPRPLVLVCHAWGGQGDHERERAAQLAEQGYLAFAMDVYGKGVRGTSTEENAALMTPLLQDRDLLEKRLLAGLETAKALELADPSKIAAIGFCFGGLCVLDMARSGADLRGVVSFHGIFRPRAEPSEGVKAKVLVLHGFDDPLANPESMVAFGHEMSAAGADWQVHAYGGTLHAFTNKGADDPKLGAKYSASADARSRQAMDNFLAEVFS